MLGRSVGNSKQLEDPPFIASFYQLAFRQLRALGTSQYILEQAMLVQPHTLVPRQVPDASIEDVVACEIDQSRALLLPWHKSQIESPPHA